MKHRSDQKGQVLAYSAISMLAFFSLAAVAVDAGRHILVGRETQAVADAMALAGATALARGGTRTDAYQAAIDIAARDRVDGTAPRVTMNDVQVGNWDARLDPRFSSGRSPANAVQTTPKFTINNIFGLWSPTSQVGRVAVAAFAPAPSLPIALCNQPWSSGLTITFKVSNGMSAGNTAAWAIYDPTLTQFPNLSVMVNYLPQTCNGGGMLPPEEVIGSSLLLGNGVGSLFNTACKTSPTGLRQCLPGNTYLLPITSAPCFGPLTGQYAVVGFVTAQIDSVDCDADVITGHAVPDCSTTISACPVPALVR